MSGDWLSALTRCQSDGIPAVLVTVAGSKGSTPRAAGTKMLVTAEHLYGTIGGGNLEHRCMEMARQMLAEGVTDSRLEHFKLGASLGQCCGGATMVLLEPFLPCDFQVWLFGAGHVGKALVHILATLPCRVTWVDNRAGQFPATLPGNVTRLLSDTPDEEVDDIPANAYVLVMTYSHDLDYRICERVLARDDFRYLGLIGSASKRRQFEKRMTHRGHEPAFWERLTCPVGIPGVGGKHPAEIAVAVVGQLLQRQTTPVASAEPS